MSLAAPGEILASRTVNTPRPRDAYAEGRAGYVASVCRRRLSPWITGLRNLRWKRVLDGRQNRNDLG